MMNGNVRPQQDLIDFVQVFLPALSRWGITPAQNLIGFIAGGLVMSYNQYTHYAPSR
jgi:hypothetical protein